MSEEQQGTEHPYEKFEEPITINIGNVCDGAAVDAFELELDKVLRNIVDPNTSATQTRHITLNVAITPKEDRTQLNTTFSCSSKLSGQIPATSRMFIGKDAENNLYALTKDPRQANLFTPPKPREAPKPIEFKPASAQ